MRNLSKNQQQLPALFPTNWSLIGFCFFRYRFSWRSASPSPWPRHSKQPRPSYLVSWHVHEQASASTTCAPFSSGPVTDFLLPTCPARTPTHPAASSWDSWMIWLIASWVKTVRITSCPNATCWSIWQTARHSLSPGNWPTCARIPASTCGRLWTKPSRRASWRRSWQQALTATTPPGITRPTASSHLQRTSWRSGSSSWSQRTLGNPYPSSSTPMMSPGHTSASMTSSTDADTLQGRRMELGVFS